MRAILLTKDFAAAVPGTGCVKTLTKTEVRTSTQNLELIDWLVEPNFTYERGFQLCFWQFQRPKKFSHSLGTKQTSVRFVRSAASEERA